MAGTCDPNTCKFLDRLYNHMAGGKSQCPKGFTCENIFLSTLKVKNHIREFHPNLEQEPSTKAVTIAPPHPRPDAIPITAPAPASAALAVPAAHVEVKSVDKVEPSSVINPPPQEGSAQPRSLESSPQSSPSTSPQSSPEKEARKKLEENNAARRLKPQRPKRAGRGHFVPQEGTHRVPPFPNFPPHPAESYHGYQNPPQFGFQHAHTSPTAIGQTYMFDQSMIPQTSPRSQPDMIAVELVEHSSNSVIWGCCQMEKMPVPAYAPSGMKVANYACGAPRVPGSMYCSIHAPLHTPRKERVHRQPKIHHNVQEHQTEQ